METKTTKGLTALRLAAMKEGEKIVDKGFDPDGAVRGRYKGSLVIRRRKGRNQVEFFLRMRAGGHDQLFKVGNFAPNGDGGLRLSDARREALKLAKLYANEGPSFKANRAAEEIEREKTEAAAREAAAQARREAAARAVEDSGENSLGKLLELYWTDMSARSRRSWKEVRNACRLHVEKAHPALWSKPARLITRDDAHAILGKLLDKGIGRVTNKLRAHLSAAFEFGLRMGDDPHHFERAKLFRVENNPVLRIRRKLAPESPRTRSLSEAEFACYLRRIDAIKRRPVLRAFLLCNVRLGGQRLEQLLRVRWSDHQDDTLRLIDSKGRGGSRLHVLPVDDAVAELIDSLRPLRVKETRQAESGELYETLADGPIFSTNGRAQMHASTVSAEVAAIAAEMLTDAEVFEKFAASDLRRTCETLLAKHGVTKDVRIELLSHGRNSLISRHYDFHDYMQQKRQALRRWRLFIDAALKDEQRQTVVPLRGKR